MGRKLLSVAALAALVSFGSFEAYAAEGCGPGAHRDRYGYCRPNAVVVVPGAVVVAPVVCGPGLRWHPGRHRCWAY